MQLAIFDLDGTITRHDTLVPYVLGYLAKSRPWRLFGLLPVLPVLVLHLLGVVDRGALKASLIRWTLGGTTRRELEAWNARFVPALLAKGVFKDALDAIARHRHSGDVLVLMSASPDLYVPQIARALGFNEVTCTGVRWNGDRLHGALTTANCRGEEKARRLGVVRAAHPNLPVVAYGNAGSDIPHLRLAERGVLVNGNRRACNEAARTRVYLENWS